MVSFPYYSHIFRDSYGSGMGIVWKSYHKGVPLQGVPENSTDKTNSNFRPLALGPTSWELGSRDPILKPLIELVVINK